MILSPQRRTPTGSPCERHDQEDENVHGQDDAIQNQQAQHGQSGKRDESQPSHADQHLGDQHARRPQRAGKQELQRLTLGKLRQSPTDEQGAFDNAHNQKRVS
jgi:hypothetical protein